MLVDLFVAAVLQSSAPASAGASAQSAHHAMVMEHGARVMPFDLTKAMHMFTATQHGGDVEVMVHGGDAKQIVLVRSHLRNEASKFALGDYSDPAYIHGNAMPGLAIMHKTTARVLVDYSDTPMGGRITLRSADVSTISAIHSWIAAQQRDHAAGDRKQCDMNARPR